MVRSSKKLLIIKIQLSNKLGSIILISNFNKVKPKLLILYGDRIELMSSLCPVWWKSL